MFLTSRKVAVKEIMERNILGNQFAVKKSAIEVFGENVFSEEVMKLRLPKTIFKNFKDCIDEGKTLDTSIADVVATAMKDWALEKGATHFTHLFFPMTGGSAEKHDSFLVPVKGGKAIEQFSGKELIKGEPDASSFPSGGLRQTFEARGYTAWDPTSPAVIIDGPNGSTLTIPTAFWSYTGEALDKKTPLLKSQEALSRQMNRILKIFGQPAERVLSAVGPEQEYFLIDKKFYALRPDILLSGRTLFGATSEKHQQLEDHYFGAIKQRVLAFMQEVEYKAFKLGIPVKTRHNEVAPAQFEIVPIYEVVNVATDHNIMLMDILKQTASKYGFACLFHEKPFVGVNGSGKHNNWSVATISGKNLLEPGDNPYENAQFLVVLSAVVRATNKYAKLLRLAVASAGNDHRLGANEAPPAIMSIFLGDELTAVVDSIITEKPMEGKLGKEMQLGVTSIPLIPKDNTDRNRTSPFAFTGNKFEFRAVGASQNVSGANIAINTIVAESVDFVATKIEKLIERGKDVNVACQKVIKEVFEENYRIIFNGNNYSDEWVKEAEKRGLPNLKSTPEALVKFIDADIVELFTKYGVFTEAEVHARYEILMEQYFIAIKIESELVVNMAKTMIIPAAIKYQGEMASSISKTVGLIGESAVVNQKSILETLSAQICGLQKSIESLESVILGADGSLKERVFYMRDKVLPAMNEVRAFADVLELLVDDELWPLPKYREMLFVY